MACIVVTTATSGTASMQRIIRTIATPSYSFMQVRSMAADTPGEETTFLDPSAKMIYWFQGAKFWNPAVDLSAFKVIVHMRDPRDLACNQFWWAQQHPNTVDPPEVAEAKRQKVRTQGIDKYVLGRNNIADYAMLLQVSAGASGDAATYTSYAQLCCAFDLLMDRLCRSFGRTQAEVAAALRIERPESLTANPNWIKVGGTWQGSDITPGRFRTELQPETIAKLAVKYEPELAFMRHRDADFLGYHYGP